MSETNSPPASTRAPQFPRTFRTTAMTFWGLVVPAAFLIAAASYDPVTSLWQPVEWFSRLVLLPLAGVRREQVDRLYQPRD